MLKKNIIKILFIFFLFFFSFNQSASAAGLVPCGLGVDDPCTLCHLFVLIDAILKFGMGILIAASLFGIAIGGIMYIVSSGRTTLIGQAKKIITNVLIGFALMLGAWLIVFATLDYLMQADPTKIGKTNWFTFKCSTVSSSTVSAPGEIVVPPSAPAVCADLNFQAGIEAQCNNDASPQLLSLLGCLVTQIGGADKFQISSISDNNGGANCPSIIIPYKKCASDSEVDCCHHKITSCHYGGNTCIGKSYAVDISIKYSKASSSEILGAATSCGVKSLEEGNHYHISVPGSCGCDAGLNFN